MRILRVVFTVVAVVVGGCRGPDSDLTATRQPIIAGTLATGDPAIMEMLSFRGNIGARCTATLVTPRMLLLAAHCFVETPGFERFLYTGNDDRMVVEADLLPIKTFVHDPQYTTPRQGHDFAFVVLEQPMAIAPLPINRTPLDQAEGKDVRYVGYGLLTVGNPNSGGVKRQNTAPLAEVSQLLLSIAPNEHGACIGDSGGPLLLDDGKGESIVGVASFVTNPACLRSSFYQRLDTQLEWIDEQIQKYDPDGIPTPGDGGAPVPTDGGTPHDAGVTDVPDAGGPDTGTMQPADPADARAPSSNEPTTSPPPGSPGEGPRPPATSSDPEREERPGSPGSSAGCSFAAGARQVEFGAGLGVLLVFALAGLDRRRRQARGT